MGTLITIGARADSAIDTDLGNLTAVRLDVLRITNRFEVLDAASHSDGEAIILRMAGELWPFDYASKHEKPSTVWHLDQLRYNSPGAAEARVYIQPGTSTTIFCQMKSGGVETFGNVARFIDPKKKKRYSLASFPL